MMKKYIKEKKIDNNVTEEVLEPLSNEEQIIDNIKDIYEQISVGDIIWAKRYNNEEEKELIPEGHREGPFIVLAKQDEKLFCAQGTSLPPYAEYFDLYLLHGVEDKNVETYEKTNCFEWVIQLKKEGYRLIVLDLRNPYSS